MRDSASISIFTHDNHARDGDAWSPTCNASPTQFDQLHPLTDQAHRDGSRSYDSVPLPGVIHMPDTHLSALPRDVEGAFCAEDSIQSGASGCARAQQLGDSDTVRTSVITANMLTPTLASPACTDRVSVDGAGVILYTPSLPSTEQTFSNNGESHTIYYDVLLVRDAASHKYTDPRGAQPASTSISTTASAKSLSVGGNLWRVAHISCHSAWHHICYPEQLVQRLPCHR